MPRSVLYSTSGSIGLAMCPFMLIVLQHNAAHLGIVTGKCLSESVTEYIRNPFLKRLILYTAVMASVSTAMAEILGGGIALQMLFNIPIRPGALLTAALVVFLQFTNAYKKIEKVIIGFVSLIGISFLIEVMTADVSWGSSLKGWVVPAFPQGSMLVIMKYYSSSFLLKNTAAMTPAAPKSAMSVHSPTLNSSPV